jgi:hypothetical protein
LIEAMGIDAPTRSIALPPSASDVEALGGELEPMTVAHACKFSLDGFKDIGFDEKEVVVMSAGFTCKSISAALVEKGVRVLDIGSAFDIKLGLKTRAME